MYQLIYAWSNASFITTLTTLTILRFTFTSIHPPTHLTYRSFVNTRRLQQSVNSFTIYNDHPIYTPLYSYPIRIRHDPLDLRLIYIESFDKEAIHTDTERKIISRVYER